MIFIVKNCTLHERILRKNNQLFFIEKIIIVCDADGPSGDWYKKFM
jgi:hypothetical protein